MIMKMNFDMFLSCVLFVCATALSSCSDPVSISGNYIHDDITIPNINGDGITHNIPKESYDVAEVIPLKIPADCFVSKTTPIFCKSRIYLLDSSRTSVLVFDSAGNFIHKVGKKGHAKSELIDEITSYDVDSADLSVHLYDREGQKILIFDSNGKYSRTVRLRDIFPSSVKLLNNGNYIASCYIGSTSEGYTKLLRINKDGVNEVVFEDRKTNNLTFEGFNTQPLSSNQRGDVSYLSMLSDSVIVISGDSVREVIRVSFDDKFLSEEEILKAKECGVLSEESDDKIRYIRSAYVTDSIINIEFLGKSNNRVSTYNYLYNRVSEKSYYVRGIISFENLLGQFYGVHNGEMVVLATEDDVEHLKMAFDIMSQQSGQNCPYRTFLDFCEESFNDISMDVLSKGQIPTIFKVKLKW